MIAQHSSATNEHYTPDIVVAPARRVLGGIDLDPASCEEANMRVGAAKIWTLADDGLAQPWHGRVFVNPPGGRVKRIGGRWLPVTRGGDKPAKKAAPAAGLRSPNSSMCVWWDRLATAWATGEIESGFFVGFTLEILRTSQACQLPVQTFPRCYPRERLPFRGDDPTHANVLVYLPPCGTTNADATTLLAHEFGDLGLCEPGTPGLLELRAARPVPTACHADPRQVSLL